MRSLFVGLMALLMTALLGPVVEPRALGRERERCRHALADVRPAVESVIAHQLARMSDFTAQLVQGEWTVW